ncbi:hypothetical protein PRIC1_001021 [Phytophthora ramorum]
MKSPAGDQEQRCDVIYHRYPSKDFDPAEKPTPVAVAIDTDNDEDASDVRATNNAAPLPPSPPGRWPSLCAQLARLLVFHTLNAILGIGGAILVLVLVPLSVGLTPLFGVGIVLFQLSAGIVEVLAKVDVRLANMVTKQEPKLCKAFGIQSGLSTNNGCTSWWQRLLFVSPKMLLVMIYFATIKLALGTLSLIAVGWGLVLPVEALCSGGRADAIGWVNYQDHPGAYVAVVLGGWALGVVCLALVWKPSVALTSWACAERDDHDEDCAARDTCDAAADLEAVIQTPTPQAKAIV